MRLAEPSEIILPIIMRLKPELRMQRPIFYRFLALGTFGLMLLNCSPVRLVDVVTPDGSGSVAKAEAYGPGKRQKLDVYWPETARANAPVVIFFYGGSWSNGARRGYSYVAESLTTLGYTTVIPDYRVYPDVQFPTFVEDGALALDWVQANLPQAAHGVVLMGHSAGAHIVALLALDQRYREKAGIDPELVRGWVGLAGPYAFQPLEWERTRPIFENLQDPQQARPIHFACEQRLPALLLHGAGDTTVLPEHSRRMANAMARCGIPARLEELPDVNHFEIALGLSSSLQILAGVLDPLGQFLEALSTNEPTRKVRTPVINPDLNSAIDG